MKKQNLTLLLLLSLFPIFSQNETISFKVVELKGDVHCKEEAGEWKKLKAGDTLSENTELFTGLHSYVSLDIGENSFLTVTQFSNVFLNRIEIKKFTFSSEIYITNGLVIASTRKVGDLDYELIISFINGRVILDNASAQIYIRKEYGTLIESETGKITVENTILKSTHKHPLLPGEKYAVLANNRTLENDYFIRKSTTLTPGNVAETEEQLYFDKLYHFYSDPSSKNSYGNRFR